MRLFLIFALCVFLLANNSANANCNNPQADAGTILFNNIHDVFQGCTKSGKWMAFHGSPNNGGGDSSGDTCETGNPGTLCSDGSFYIGSLAGGPRIYAAPNDLLATWKNSQTLTSNSASTTDGYANTYNALNNPVHPAGYACASMAPAGTWYLPALDELNLIWLNAAQIDLGAKGISTNSSIYYWSSTEAGAPSARSQRFSDGFNGAYGGKDSSARVRCVRR